MALSDFLVSDLDVLFNGPFGVPASMSNGKAGKVIFDQPTQELVGEMVLSTDYQITAKTSTFGVLNSGAEITVNGIEYVVRETRLMSDGLLCEISLQTKA